MTRESPHPDLQGVGAMYQTKPLQDGAKSMSERHRAAWIGAAVVAASVTLVGCSGGAGDSARAAADTVASAAPTLDYAKAKTVLCPEFGPKDELTVFNLSPLSVNSNVKFTFANSTKTNDTTYQVVYKESEDSNSDGYVRHLDGMTIFTVKKEGNAWKVCGVESQQ